MRFRVQRSFTFCGKNLARGEEVDIDNSDRVVQLCEQRFLLPISGDKPIPTPPESISEVVRKTRSPSTSKNIGA